MADTVRWLLDQHGPDSRIVTLLHNGHAQRIPCTLAPSLSMLPMGQHLATQFGDEYAAVALTCTEGTTPCVALDPDAPLGMTMWETALPPPRPGSVEALLAGSGLSLLDLRDPPPTGPSLMRHADDHIPVPAFAAFDAVIHVPTVRTTSFIDHRVESARTPPR